MRPGPGAGRLLGAALLALSACGGGGGGEAPAPDQPPAGVDVRDHGARCDGRTDDVQALRSAIAAARGQGRAVVVPAAVCAYGDVIRLDGVSLLGQGTASVLHALDWSRQALFVEGDGVQVRQLRFTGVPAPARQSAWEATRITLFGATNWQIEGVTIDSAAAAGIQTARGARQGRISGSVVRHTLADGIHLTDRASDIVVEHNRIEDTGDDGIAVVSYQADGGPVQNITARGNVVLANRWGRQMSVVGGRNVLYEHNHLADNLAGFACLYVAQEAPFATQGAHDVTARRNTLVNCGSHATGHGAVMLYSDGAEPNTGITFERNEVQQAGQPGFVVTSAFNTGVRLDANRVSGAAPALRIETPGVVVLPYDGGPVGADVRP